MAFVAFRLVLVLLIVAAIFKLSGAGRWRRNEWRKQRLVYVESIRNMNDYDFQHFKNNFRNGNGHCPPHHYK